MQSCRQRSPLFLASTTLDLKPHGRTHSCFVFLQESFQRNLARKVPLTLGSLNLNR
jgi:hypothetical protein